MIFGQYFHVFNILIVFLIILDSGTYFGIFFSILYMFISDYFFIIPIGSVLDSKDGIQQLIINSVISILAAFLFNLLLRSYKYSKRSYLAINQEKKRYESLVKGLNESAIVAMTDRKGKIIFVNDMFCKVSGYSSDELICKTHKIINSDFHPPEFFKQMWQTILKEECGIMKFVIEGKMVLCIG